MSHHGLNGFIRIIFGLKNAPGTVQRIIDFKISKFGWKEFLVYLDEIVVFYQSVEEHKRIL